jgi:putative Holliday junction resolvase
VTETDPERANLTPAPEGDKPHTEAAAFARLVPAGVLPGLDPGTKTIGVAACDTTRRLASPVETIRRTKWTADVARLRQIAEARGAVGIVLGLPLNMDDSAGPRAQAARQMAKNLIRALRLPVLLWDERLTSFAAEEAMAEAGLSAARRRERVDRAAAALILQAAMDAMAQAG